MTAGLAQSVTLADVLAARDRIAGQTLVTPFLEARVLSQMTGAQVFVKFENLQFTASFKERGALNRLSMLTPEERHRGVCAMSAGNHAQGVAFHAKRLGIPALIVMPETTALTKIEHTRDHGAEVVLHGRSLTEAAEEALRLTTERNLVFIHPYDDPAVIAGQGTTALEMLDVQPDLDAIIVPVGGGGLISGMAIAAKTVRPGISVIGVQARSHPAMVEAVTGRHESAQNAHGNVATIADGIAVKKPGALTRAIIEEYVDQMLTVPEWAIEKAVALFINVEKTVAEGAGAASLACLLSDPEPYRGKKVGIVLSGGNIDARLLASILIRELTREGRLVTIRLAVADQPGLLARITGIMAGAGANIVEVQHRRTWLARSANEATVDIVFEARDAAHAKHVMACLDREGLQPEVL